MGIRESLLNTITSVGNSDFVRIVTSAGASSKATVRNLFKGFESNLGAKSSLTDSDYIRVVGSDNEAYKQSISSMKTAMGIDALNSNSDQGLTTSYASEMTCFKRGNVGFLRIRDPKGLASGASTTVATLPVGYRPELNINHYLPVRGSSYSAGIGVLIDSNGSIAFYNYSANTGTINAQGIIAYPLKV